MRFPNPRTEEVTDGEMLCHMCSCSLPHPLSTPNQRLLRCQCVKGNRDPPQFPSDNRFFIRDIYMKVLPRDQGGIINSSTPATLFAIRSSSIFSVATDPRILLCGRWGCRMMAQEKRFKDTVEVGDGDDDGSTMPSHFLLV